MNFNVYDIVILLVLAAFALWGMRRGFVMTLCSLIALLVALVGALAVTNFFAPAVAGWLEPVIQPSVAAAVEEALPEEATQAGLSREQLLELLEQTDLPFGLEDSLAELVEQLPTLEPQTVVEDVALSLTQKAAQMIAKALVFLVCFVLILILWHLLAHALDLVARLPGLHFLNRVGGLALGAVRGAVFVFACLWLLRFSGLLPQQAADGSALLPFFLSRTL